MSTQEPNQSDAIRQKLTALLESHGQEIEDALIARMRNSDLDVPLTPDALAGLRPAAIESVNAMASAFEKGEEWAPTVPPAVIAQIQYMARHGASLETVLRGYSLVGGAFFEFFAAKLSDFPQAQDVLRFAASWQSQHNDRLMSAFAAEYTKEVERLKHSPSRQLTERVRRLLDGGSGDIDLDYRLDAFHIGLIADGARAELACRSLAERLGCDLLFLPHAEDTAWVWLGARRQIDFAELEQAAAGNGGSLSLAAGEQRHGIGGWRLSHREAQAARVLALVEPAPLTRYSDVALLATAFCDEATGRSLIDRYLGPLDRNRDGEGLRRTLRTYLDLDCNAASTAAALDVDRHTVQRRLKKVEESVGEPLSVRRAELDVALRLERLTATAAPNGSPDH